MNSRLSQLAHDGTSLAFTACVLLLVALPVLVGTGATHRLATALGFDKSNDQNSFSADAPYTPPRSTQDPIGAGDYAGWTLYHNNTFGFGVNIPDGIRMDEIPQTHAVAPRYPNFMLQLSTTEKGVAVEFARVTVYDTDLSVNEQAQDTSTDPLFAGQPTKTTGQLLGRQSIQYFYHGDTRTAVYLIASGDRTIEVRGVVDLSDPAAVTAYWNTFNKLLKSLTID